MGAARNLQDIENMLKSTELQHKTTSLTANNDIQWHFSPARAPHFGGLWEAGVRIMKLLLKKLVGEHKLTYMQLYAVIVEVGLILNSRPLLPIHVDPEQGPTILTPGH